MAEHMTLVVIVDDITTNYALIPSEKLEQVRDPDIDDVFLGHQMCESTEAAQRNVRLLFHKLGLDCQAEFKSQFGEWEEYIVDQNEAHQYDAIITVAWFNLGD